MQIIGHMSSLKTSMSTIFIIGRRCRRPLFLLTRILEYWCTSRNPSWWMMRKKLWTMKMQIQIQKDTIRIRIPMKMNGQEKDGEVMKSQMNMDDEEHGNLDLIVMRISGRRVAMMYIHILRRSCDYWLIRIAGCIGEEVAYIWGMDNSSP